MIEPNIDPAEVAYYERLADTWWDRAGPFWPLHRLNEIRSEFLRETLCTAFGRDPAAARPLQGLRLLDVGCGGGILSESMTRLGATVHGVDVVSRNITVASLHARDAGLDIEYETIALDALLARGSRYDVVLNMEVVEHVPDVGAFMADCAALVAADGVMVVATLNRSLRAFVAAIVGAEYVLRWLPRGTHRWSRFCRPEELTAMLDAAGLDVVRRTGVAVNPLTRHFSLTASLAINFMLVGRRRAPPVGTAP